MMVLVIFSNYCVNSSILSDKKYIFLSGIVISLLFCNFLFIIAIRVLKKGICLIFRIMESNFDGYDG
jgi:hypothetical protein